MILLYIFFALWWIWLPLLIYWVYRRAKSNSETPATSYAATSDQEIDSQWRNYIASFQRVVKTKAEKNLLEALLTQKTADELYGKAKPKAAEHAEMEPAYSEEMTHVMASRIEPATISQPAKPPSEPLDNTLLLLYFGAFLLVASAGLFVALGSMDGLLRTVTLAITASLLYMAGLWIYQTKKKLKQAGISFMGTAMVMAPLVGVAWYNLVAQQTHGALIWLATSIACLGLYVHALSKASNDFTAYLLIGSFVSSIESAILMIALPSYAFAWGLICASLVLQIFKLKGSSHLKSAQDTSAQLLVPLSIIGSAVLLPEFGNTQLAITLLLSGSYYALQAWQRPAERQSYATAAQLSVISAVANLSYSINQSFWVVGLALASIALVYALVIAIAKLHILEEYNLPNIAMLSGGAGIVLSIADAWSLVACSTAWIMLSVVVWLRMQSKDALSIASALALAVPLIIGQYALDHRASPNFQLLLCAIPTVAIGILTIMCCKKQLFRAYYDISALFYVVGTIAVLITAWLTDFTTLLATCLALGASYIVMQYASKESGWWIFAGSVMMIPILYASLIFGTGDPLFSLSTGIGLISTVAISLKTREPALRWLVVVCILLSPVALGEGGLGMHWDEARYSGGYLLAMAACVLARAIARGKVLVSSKVPVSSYDEQASQAYVIGYIGAGLIALVVSLYDINSQIVTTLVLGALSLALIGIAKKVENDDQTVSILPLLLQAMLLSGLRPDLNDQQMVGVSALSASVLAVAIYYAVAMATDIKQGVNKTLLSVSVFTAYIGLGFAIITTHHSIMLPISLAIAGALTFYHNRDAVQSTRELCLGIVITATHWLLYILGVHNVHIHTHLLALFLAGFALWRSSLGDKNASNSYIQALFCVATIPLALQALSDESGGLYGLLLIAQQIFFMVLGALFGLRFLLKAGMWVALAAILYQLRGLGWAFLSLLALILIGIAIYRLQQHSDPEK